MRPNDIGVRRGLGIALVQSGQLAEAEAVRRSAVVTGPNDGVARNTLGAALAGQGKLDEATRCFERALALDPNDGGRGRICSGLGPKGRGDGKGPA